MNHMKWGVNTRVCVRFNGKIPSSWQRIQILLLNYWPGFRIYFSWPLFEAQWLKLNVIQFCFQFQLTTSDEIELLKLFSTWIIKGLCSHTSHQDSSGCLMWGSTRMALKLTLALLLLLPVLSTGKREQIWINWFRIGIDVNCKTGWWHTHTFETPS